MQSSLISFALFAPNEGDVSAHFKQIITTTAESWLIQPVENETVSWTVQSLSVLWWTFWILNTSLRNRFIFK